MASTEDPGQQVALPFLSGDWPSQLTDRLESAVHLVGDKAVRPAMTVGRALVYGTFAGLLALAVTAFGVVGLVRLIDVYAFPTRIWATYALLGFVFVASGAFLWSLRRARAK